MDRDQKLEIVAFVIIGVVCIVVWRLATADRRLSPDDLSKQRQIQSDDELRRMQAQQAAMNANRKSANPDPGPALAGPADEESDDEAFQEPPRPVMIIGDPNIELLKNQGSINRGVALERDRQVLTIPSDVTAIPEELKERYRSSEDYGKKEIRADTRDMEWALDDATGALYLKSRGGMVEIRNFTPEVEDSISEDLILTKRYISGKGPINQQALPGYKPIYERQGEN